MEKESYGYENNTKTSGAYFVCDALCIFLTEAIHTGKRVGLFKGDGTGHFSPEAPITRKELMTMVARGMLIRYALDTGKMADLAAYSDGANVADYATNAVATVIGNGIVNGNADGTLNPTGNATRAEAAVIMARILKISPDVSKVVSREGYNKDLQLLSTEELAVCEEIFLNTDNIKGNTAWGKKLEKNGTTYVLAQNLKKESSQIKVSDCAGDAAEILCGVRPDDASYSYKKCTLSVTLNGHTTALVKILPEKTQGFYNDSDVKIGYLCDGTRVSAKSFQSYPVFVGIYAQTENNHRQLLDVFILSAADAYKPLTIPEVEGATAYSVEAFSWDWRTNFLQPEGAAYCLRSK